VCVGVESETMYYDHLISKIEEETGIPFEVIKRVLAKLPAELNKLKPGEQVRTPLGTFICWAKEAKPIRLPNGDKVMRKPEEVIRLRPGKKLRKK
tara:strand:- start:1659 stop:1943 length:285 start_codon:yes stop_codon:yes gene_type:complete